MKQISNNEDGGARAARAEGSDWAFLTTHAAALILIHRSPDIRLRDIATTVGVTERTAHTVVRDLVQAGYVRSMRQGRRNHYRVVPGQKFRREPLQDVEVEALFEILADSESDG